MPGSIRVSFAGTFGEAVEFASQHKGITAPKGLATAGDDDCLPMLCARYRNEAERRILSRKLTRLGWDPEFQMTVPNGRGFHGVTR